MTYRVDAGLGFHRPLTQSVLLWLAAATTGVVLWRGNNYLRDQTGNHLQLGAMTRD